MQRSTRNLLILIIVIVSLCLVVLWPGNSGLNKPLGLPINRAIQFVLGLDLQGGLEVVLQALQSADTPVNADTMAAAKSIVENRVNALGVSEPLVQSQGSNRIIVELPGLANPEEAIRTLGQTGLLEFIDAGDIPPMVGSVVTTTLGGIYAGDELTSTVGLTNTAAVSPGAALNAGRVFTTVMTGRLLKSASIGYDELGKPEINFELRKAGDRPEDDGPKIFGDWTTKNVGKYLAITLDKEVLSAPVIQNPITQGSGRITGSFTLPEVQRIVTVLKYGALPVALEIIESRSIGPTLGQDSVRKSVVAGVIGLIIVGLFMAIYYRLPGLVADAALIIYTLIVLTLFKLIPVTLTLAGIAGFILSIGMAVDANILIFERMKEEIRAGKTLGAAIEAGFARAWNSIRDSNVSTLITCFVLFVFGSYFGTSVIKGFAVTLAIGVLCSLFTAIIVTRTFLRVTQHVMFPRPDAAQEPRLRRLFGVLD